MQRLLNIIYGCAIQYSLPVSVHLDTLYIGGEIEYSSRMTYLSTGNQFVWNLIWLKLWFSAY